MLLNTGNLKMIGTYNCSNFRPNMKHGYGSSKPRTLTLTTNKECDHFIGLVNVTFPNNLESSSNTNATGKILILTYLERHTQQLQCNTMIYFRRQQIVPGTAAVVVAG